MPCGKPIVFLGLSLGVEEARAILDADYRGPLVRGDLDAIDAPTRVVIIDGILDAEKRLTVEEGRRALARGLVLHGASSTGALLALELESAGMHGHGEVFRTLRTLTGDREDLVKALFAGDSLRPFTVPLIHAIVACRRHGYSVAQIDCLLHALRALPLDERSWDNIRHAVTQTGLSLPSRTDAMDAKRDDACALLRSFRPLPSERQT